MSFTKLAIFSLLATCGLTAPFQSENALNLKPRDDGGTLSCTAGKNGNKFLTRNDTNAAIGLFCPLLATAYSQFADKQRYSQPYYEGQWREVWIGVEWTGNVITTTAVEDCTQHMTRVMDSCDGNEPTTNPRDWKYGGSVQVGPIKYTINPDKDAGWTPGTCTVQVTEQIIGIHGKPWVPPTFTNITVSDGSGHQVAQNKAGGRAPLGGGPFNWTPSPLPSSMGLSIPVSQTGLEQSQPVTFSYNGDDWNDSSQGPAPGIPDCKELSAWDNTKGRTVSCQFAC